MRQLELQQVRRLEQQQERQRQQLVQVLERLLSCRKLPG